MNSARAVALVSLIAGCRTGDSHEGLPYRTVIETIGDTIVARTTGDVPATHLRQLVVEWRAAGDGNDSATTIGDVSGIAVAPDGQVFVWDPATPTLWLVEANGASMKRLTRAGSGPGEARQVNGIAVRRDGSVVMWDEGNTRLNVYGPDGAYRASSPLAFSRCCPSNAVAVDSHARVWLRGGVGGAREKADLAKAFGRDTPAFFRFDSSGSLIDTVVTPKLPGDTPVLVAMSQSGKGVSMSCGRRPSERSPPTQSARMATSCSGKGVPM